MKKFLALYLGSTAALDQWKALDDATRKEKEQAGMAAWKKWFADNKSSIVYDGSPLGKTKRVDVMGVSDTKNEVGAFTVVQAESYEAAAQLFVNHPHFTIFPGERIEVMECLAIPGM